MPRKKMRDLSKSERQREKPELISKCSTMDPFKRKNPRVRSLGKHAMHVAQQPTRRKPDAQKTSEHLVSRSHERGKIKAESHGVTYTLKKRPREGK